MATPNPELKPTTQPVNSTNYYNAPYGYQTNGVIPPAAPLQNIQADANIPRPGTPQQNVYQQGNIYMQSGTGTTASTQTTKSGNTYATSSQQSPMTPAKQQTTKANETKPAAAPTNAPTTTAPTAPAAVAKPVKKSSNIDLLSDIDFSGVAAVPPPILPEPVLKPQVVSSPPASQVAAPETPKKIEEKEDKTQKEEKIKQVEVIFYLNY